MATRTRVVKVKKPPPHEFILDALAEAEIHTKPMFGALAVYVGERIVLILRDRPNYTDDNGVWIVSLPEHHPSLGRELKSLREIRMFSEGGPANWLNLPAESPHFEEDALQACALILSGDPRIGKVPVRKARKSRVKKP